MESLKVLCIGNSFSQDTTAYLPEIALDLGRKPVIGNLYIGGCPIAKHYENIKQDLPAYRFDRNDGTGWQRTPDTRIQDAIAAEDWDWICIQHGSSHGGYYTEDASYQDLPALVQAIQAQSRAKIAFNLTWVGDPEKDRPEMILFQRDPLRYFQAICAITQRLVAPVPGIALVSPTGTAVQNACSLGLGDRMCRDGFHLSMDVGRYLAGLAFYRALTGQPVKGIRWMPEGVTEQDLPNILQAIDQAFQTPYYENRPDA